MSNHLQPEGAHAQDRADWRRSITRISAIAVFATTLLALAPAALGGANGVNPPLGIHLQYLDDPTTAVIVWHTTSAATSRAEWGTAHGPPYPYFVTGTDYSGPQGSRLHRAVLTGLTPGTTYYYRVGDTTMTSWYGEATFRAAPVKGSSNTFTFAAAGDWGYNDITTATSNAIAAKNPNLVLLLGDLYYNNNESKVKDVYQRWQAFGQGSFAQTGVGNHEYPGPDKYYTPTEVYCAFVHQPGNERTFAYTFGNTLFMTIDWGYLMEGTGDGMDGGGPSCEVGGQTGTAAIRNWVDTTLAAANVDNNIKWKVVYQHFLCYDTTLSAYDDIALCPAGYPNPDQIEDILVDRGVDIVLQGHEHVMGRTHPVKFNTRQQSGSNYTDPHAPIYFVLGTGGAPKTLPCRTDPWVAACRSVATAGFGYFTVTPTQISYEFDENTVGVLDTMTLSKTPPTDFAVSVSPTSTTMKRNETRTATVTVSGFSNGPVNLSVTGCPANTNCTLSPTSGTPAFLSTLTISTSTTSPLGSYTLTIVGANGSVSHNATFALEISQQTTRTYQKGDGGAYSETDDTYLYNLAPSTNYGTNVNLRVDGQDCVAVGGLCRTLLKYPLLIGDSDGQIPVGSVIDSAVLELRVTNTGADQDLYQVTEPWLELGATWDSFATPGFPQNNGKVSTFQPMTIGWITVDLKSIVQGWADGQANQGIFIASTNGDGVYYDSSEGTGHPKLTVVFEPPAGPGSFDFSVFLSPTSGSVSPGSSTSTTATAKLLSGTTHPVSFSASGLPPGANASFNPTQCSPTCPSTMTITTSSGTPLGTYAILVKASDGTLERNATYTLTVSSIKTYAYTKGDGGAYSETDDSHIVSGTPTTNYGTATTFRVDNERCITSPSVCRALVKYPNIVGPNNGQVTPGSVIISATLQFTITDPGGTQNAYQLTEGWTESNVTWNSFAVPGSPTTKGSPVSYASPKTRIGVNITAFVQNWVNGDANQGIFITTTSGNGAYYSTSESTAKPTLTVTFRTTDGGSSPGAPALMSEPGHQGTHSLEAAHSHGGDDSTAEAPPLTPEAPRSSFTAQLLLDRRRLVGGVIVSVTATATPTALPPTSLPATAATPPSSDSRA